jgi:hypothetical protein
MVRGRANPTYTIMVALVAARRHVGDSEAAIVSAAQRSNPGLRVSSVFMAIGASVVGNRLKALSDAMVAT